MVARLTDLLIEETEKLRTAAKGPRPAPQAAPAQGRLVVIGPTRHEDGQPMEISELPANSPMFVGWCESSEFGELIGTLQEGNPQRLALYGSSSAERHEVYRLQRVLRHELIRGEWYCVGAPLIAVIELLQRNSVPDELGGSVYC
jgi:hypothetical protein